MDPVLSLLISGAFGLGGVWLGADLSRQTALDLAGEQREWSERQAVRQRQDEAAARFDERLMEAMSAVPQGVATGREAVDALDEAWGALRQAWTRTTVLDDRGLEDRIKALDMALFIAGQDAQFRKDETINFWAIGVAIRDLRRALAAFQRRESLPEAEFPSAKELIQIAHPPEGRNVGIEGANQWLSDRGVL